MVEIYLKFDFKDRLYKLIKRANDTEEVIKTYNKENQKDALQDLLFMSFKYVDSKDVTWGSTKEK